MYGTLTIQTLVIGWSATNDIPRDKQVIVSTIHGVTQEVAQRIVDTHGSAAAMGAGGYRYSWKVEPIDLVPTTGSAQVAHKVRKS